KPLALFVLRHLVEFLGHSAKFLRRLLALYAECVKLITELPNPILCVARPNGEGSHRDRDGGQCGAERSAKQGERASERPRGNRCRHTEERRRLLCFRKLFRCSRGGGSSPL